VALVPGVAHAGPWTPDPGHGYAKLWLSELPGFDYHAGDGRTIGLGLYDEASLNAYGEVGVYDGVAISLHVPLARVAFLEDPRDGHVVGHVAPGDPTLSVRWRFLRFDRFVAAVDAGVRLPFAAGGVWQNVYAGTAPHELVGGLEMGTAVVDVHGGLSFGAAWDRIYVTGGATFVGRTGGWDQVFAWSAEVGGSPFDTRFGIRLRVVGWHPLIRGSEPRGESPNGVSNGTEYVGIGVEGEWWLDAHWAVGGAFQGGLGALHRQIGGPVVDVYVAAKF
jgi:hypothetical protein